MHRIDNMLKNSNLCGQSDEMVNYMTSKLVQIHWESCKRLKFDHADTQVKNDNICHCLPPDRTWHKVKSPKADTSKKWFHIAFTGRIYGWIDIIHANVLGMSSWHHRYNPPAALGALL